MGLYIAPTAVAGNPHDLSAANFYEDDMDDELHNSLHLKSLVAEYLEPSSETKTGRFGTCESTLPPTPSFACDGSGEKNAFIQDQLQAIVHEAGREYKDLRREVTRAARNAGLVIAQLNTRDRDPNSPLFKHEHLQAMVLEHLRDVGFNAGICKSTRVDRKHKANKTHFPAEEYIYMDVIVDKGGMHGISERMIIDLRFREEFEIARPTPAYVDLLKLVPTCYVGSPHVLHRIIKLLSGAMKSSLESQGMPFPPWRTLSFLHSKWLSSQYSRTLTFTLSHNIKAPPLYIPQKPPKRKTSTPKSISKPSILIPTENSIANMNTSIQPHPPNPPSHNIRKLVLTNCNSMLPLLQPPLTTKNGSSRLHVMLESGKPPWQLPPLSKCPNSLKKPRNSVGALAIALQDASIAMKTRNSGTVMTSSYLFKS